MITYKEAVKAARDYAMDLFSQEELRGLRVEELVPSDDQKYWNVTLGWVAPDTRTVSAASSPLGVPPGPRVVHAPRVYKMFKIDAESGAVVSMVMRD